ncbi:MAG: amidohydrolase, partial [Myxococcales bacterium]|nr:amidohydrolase [Myxococcales bacterium]
YDYDPVWAKCLELRVVPTFHSGGMGWGSRTSISNMMYNHIGHFAAAAEAVCKSLFFGGVTRRFPDLRFGFLEGGAGWACALYNDLIGHWEKHNVASIASLDPARLDEELMRSLFERHAGPAVAKRLDEVENRSDLLWGRAEAPEDLDEWIHCEISRKVDIRDLFVPNFYFGCEGDDRLTGWAFDATKNALGARLHAIYGSDLGHFDLSDMRAAASEAWELVEEGVLDEENFRDFVFTHPARFKAEVNPDFFVGTAVESAVAELLAQ